MTQPVSSVTAVLPKDTVYTVNDSDVKVVDGRPSLLVDEIVSTDNSASGSDYRGVLVDKAVKLVGEGFQNVATQAKYLDLVDAAKGYYFTIITMVFCEIVRVVELNWMSLTRGPLGIMAIPKPSFLGFEITTPRQFYFMILVLVALSTLVVSNLMKSRVGYAILAIRDDELAAEAMGIHVFRYKMIVFILSSLLVGLAGAFYATYTSYIDPSSFAAAQSNDMLVMVIFGGLGNTVGSFIGAISLSILPEALRDLAQYRQLIYGVLLVLLMMVKPQGLLGDINFKYIRQRMEHREKSKEAANE